MTAFNPQAKLEVKAYDSHEEFMKDLLDAPHTIPRHTPLSDERRHAMSLHLTRLRRTVQMEDEGKLNRTQYHNERILSGLVCDLGEHVLTWTSEQALGAAIELERLPGKHPQIDDYVKLASALELRSTYQARAF